MKYKIITLLIFIIILTGCETGTIKCKKTYDDTIKYSVKISATVKNNKIETSNAKLSFKNSSDASNFCELNKMINNEFIKINCYDKDIIIDNYHHMEIDDYKNNYILKKDFVEKLTKKGFKCN